ncbi:hypothetical protein M758_7G070900 [Ceratodon purpureus]|nr:hypothetical protein M758_7G070900 [Ceratodon purpureus]
MVNVLVKTDCSSQLPAQRVRGWCDLTHRWIVSTVIGLVSSVGQSVVLITAGFGPCLGFGPCSGFGPFSLSKPGGYSWSERRANNAKASSRPVHGTVNVF